MCLSTVGEKKTQNAKRGKNTPANQMMFTQSLASQPATVQNPMIMMLIKKKNAKLVEYKFAKSVCEDI